MVFLDPITVHALAGAPLPLRALPPPVAGRGAAFIAARDAASEQRAVDAQRRAQREAAELSLRASRSSATPRRGLGDAFEWPRIQSAAAPHASSSAAYDAARDRAWAAGMLAALAALQAKDAARLLARRAGARARAAPADGAPLASLRHVPTRFGVASGRRRGPLPTQTMRVVASSEEAELEALIAGRKFWRYGDFLQNRESVE